MTIEFGFEPIEQKRKGTDFSRTYPVGTLMIDTSILQAGDLQHPYAWTAKGEIYDDPKSRKVNVVNINGEEGKTDTWSIGFLQQGYFRENSDS